MVLDVQENIKIVNRFNIDAKKCRKYEESLVKVQILFSMNKFFMTHVKKDLNHHVFLSEDFILYST